MPPTNLCSGLGHTAYWHTGLGATSTPYYLFGAQRRYPFAWHGGAGGVPWSRVAAETRELSDFDLRESGLTPYTVGYPAFRHTTLHLGDWPAVRPAGPEPLDPGGLGALPIWGTLSDNEKRLALIAGVAALGLVAWRRLRRKRGRRR